MKSIKFILSTGDLTQDQLFDNHNAVVDFCLKICSQGLGSQTPVLVSLSKMPDHLAESKVKHVRNREVS